MPQILVKFFLLSEADNNQEHHESVHWNLKPEGNKIETDSVGEQADIDSVYWLYYKSKTSTMLGLVLI